MKHITGKIEHYYRYNGKFYKVSGDKEFFCGDIFIDCRDYSAKLIQTELDRFDLSFIDPELYVILKEVTIEN